MIACYWKSTYQELKDVKAWNVTVWNIMEKFIKALLLYGIVDVSLFFFIGIAERQ